VFHSTEFTLIGQKIWNVRVEDEYVSLVEWCWQLTAQVGTGSLVPVPLCPQQAARAPASCLSRSTAFELTFSGL